VWTTVAIVNNDFDADRKDVTHYTQKNNTNKKISVSRETF